MREFLGILLERDGYTVTAAASAEAALALMQSNPYDLILSDVSMPGLSGIDLLDRVKEMRPDTAVLLITAYSTAETAVEAMKRGAYDYIAKPFKVEEIKVLVRNALEKRALVTENRRLKQAVEERYGQSGIIGKSRPMQQLFTVIEKVAASSATVLITGESGTGKELVAHALHLQSACSHGPFVPINCGAIPENLMESELFGYTKGSFTGAVANKAGLFEQAEGGSIFLDEIGELSPNLQAKLLRVLQEKEIRRIGASESIKINARVICATNRDLDKAVAAGHFREDLYYRINVIQLVMPPLRERSEDIPLLVDHFCRKFNSRVGGVPVTVTPGAMAILMQYPFPGNIRELENCIERCLILDPALISVETLPRQLLAGKGAPLSAECDIPEGGIQLEPLLEELEKKYLLSALEMTGGAKKKAGELLGMSFRSFRYRLVKFGLDSDEE